AFINFGRNFILSEYGEALPHKRTVIEVLEDVEPDPALLQKLQQLRSKGYRIALDDFSFDERFYPLLDVADYVKVDILASGWHDVERCVPRLKRFPVQLIAEKVETPEQFQACKNLGFDFFQGYFFCRPQVMASRRMPANRLVTLRLISKLNNPDIKM